jgi:hypothetical protein
MPPQPSPMSDQAHLARILARYGGDPDIVWLVEQLEPRQCRVKRRDALTRAALQEHFPDKPTCSARALGRALSAYASSNWPAEQHLPALPDSASPRHCALHAILRANGGKPLGWRQIVNIAGGIAKKEPLLQPAYGKIAS